MSKKKLSIVCFSGQFDKAIAIFTLASGAAAVNYEVNLFFTFWGFNIIKKKKNRAPLGAGLMSRFFNFLMGGRNKLPLSLLNFGGLSPKLMTGLMKKRNTATLEQLYQASIDLGVNFYGCEMSMNIFKTKKEDYIDEMKDVIGVATFLKLAEGGETLFIS